MSKYQKAKQSKNPNHMFFWQIHVDKSHNILFNISISQVFPLFILIVHNIAHNKTYSFWDTCYINVITHVVLFFSLFTIFLLFIIVYCCMIKISTPNSQHLHIKIERQNDSSQRPSQARKSCSKGENSDFFLRRPKKFEAVNTSNYTLVMRSGSSPKGGFEYGFQIFLGGL